MVTGIYVDNLEVPWMEGIYRLAEKMDLVLFTNNYGKVDPASTIGVCSSYYLWSFFNPVIACDVFSARYLSECTVTPKKFFYVNNCRDWTAGFSAFDTIKVAKELTLITEPEFQETVEAVWGPTEIVRNWRHEDIQRILSA